ncbi:hypothetical protein [Bacteroides caecimuris]|nr:hypothetical protein [Bacteroides caecimuris]
MEPPRAKVIGVARNRMVINRRLRSDNTCCVSRMLAMLQVSP